VPETAVSAAHKLINQEGVAAIVGPMFSSNAIPVSEVAEAAHIPMLSPTSTNPKTTLNKQFIFRASFVDDFQGAAMARFAYDELGGRKSAVLYDIASEYNKGLAAAYQTAFESLGGQIVAMQTYTTDKNEDYSQQLTVIQALDPDILFLPNYTDDVLLQGQQAREMGIDALILGGDSWEGARLAAQPAFEYSFFSGHYCRDKSIPNIRDFSERFETLYGREPNGLMALTYDSMQLLFAAMQTQTEVTSETIRDGLYQIEYQGITGTIKFEETGDPIKSVAIWQISEGDRRCYQMINP
jgi:branched-chain amino acid transport system substrate-binding protein